MLNFGVSSFDLLLTTFNTITFLKTGKQLKKCSRLGTRGTYYFQQITFNISHFSGTLQNRQTKAKTGRQKNKTVCLSLPTGRAPGRVSNAVSAGRVRVRAITLATREDGTCEARHRTHTATCSAPVPPPSPPASVALSPPGTACRKTSEA
jgi:hypothetical protein